MTPKRAYRLMKLYDQAMKGLRNFDKCGFDNEIDWWLAHHRITSILRRIEERFVQHQMLGGDARLMANRYKRDE